MLIKAGSIPKTSSGKIQRHACRDGFLDGTLDVVGRVARRGTPRRMPADAASGPDRPPTPPAGAATCCGQPRRAYRQRREPSHVTASTAEIVLEQVRRVAKERADGITLDSSIVELGLDSLERMEILASLEETFGGRFPEEVLPQIETCREVVAAVETYLGTAPRPRAISRSIHEIPPENYRFECFPEYLKLRADDARNRRRRA